MDAGLAKVINSTVGTSDFKSFDEILEQGKSMVATDEKYFVFPSNLQDYTTPEPIANNVDVNVFSFTLPLDGSCYLKCKVGHLYQTKEFDVYIKVLKNGELYEARSNSSHVANCPVMDILLEGTKGDVFSVSMYQQRSVATTDTLGMYLYSINASVVRNKALDINYFV